MKKFKFDQVCSREDVLGFIIMFEVSFSIVDHSAFRKMTAEAPSQV